MLDAFTRHPRSVDETYGQHMATAWSFAFPMIVAGLACFVHGLLPFLFETAGSRCVKRLHARMGRRGAPIRPETPVPTWPAFDAVI